MANPVIDRPNTHSAPAPVPTAKRDHQWLPFTPNRDFQLDPRIFVAAKGMEFTTQHGKKVIDGISSLWCVAAGHNRAPINEAIKRQLDTLDYATAFQASNDRAYEASARIAALAPGDLNRVLFCNSGSEAADTSLKLALAYHRARGEGHRNVFIGRERGYHGVGFGGMSVGGIASNRKVFGSALLPRVDHLRFIHDPVKQAFIHGEVPVWDEDLLLELEQRILPLHDASNIAAVIVEPVAGSAGWYIPPQGYLKRLREICDKHGILLIFDEVITGFGRHQLCSGLFRRGARHAQFCEGRDKRRVSAGWRDLPRPHLRRHDGDRRAAVRHRVFSWLYLFGTSGGVRGSSRHARCVC
jgi:beta-alanine--pyruvate transaminase